MRLSYLSQGRTDRSRETFGQRMSVVRFCILFAGGAEAAFSVIQQTIEYAQPRPYSFFLRSRFRRRVPAGVRGRSASCAIRSGTSMILVAVLDSFDLCHSHSLEDPSFSFARPVAQVVLQLTRPVFTIALVTSGGPLTPTRVAILRVLLRGRSPTPVKPGERLAILSRVARHV